MGLIKFLSAITHEKMYLYDLSNFYLDDEYGENFHSPYIVSSDIITLIGNNILKISLPDKNVF